MNIFKKKIKPLIARLTGMRWMRLFGHEERGRKWERLRKPISRIGVIALLLVASTGLAAPDRSFQVPFQYAKTRNSILIAARINDMPVVLILDTGAAHTVLCPNAAGVDPKELIPTHPGSGGGGFIGDAVGQEITLQIGAMKWEKRRVAVMDLSQVLSVYSEKIDGILGLDFLQQFREVVINIKERSISFIGQAGSNEEGQLVPIQVVPAGKLSFGNLRKLNLEGGAGRYTLNGVELVKLDDRPMLLSDAEQRIKVRATFLETVKVSGGEAVYGSKKALVEDWAKRIPVVAEILKKKDSTGSLKPVVYDLLEPENRKDFKLQEELVLLWSADRMKVGRIGDTTLMPPASFPIRIEGDISLMTPIQFSDRVVDVQYRGRNGGTDSLIPKIILQILYIRDGLKRILLGGFVIVSKSDGEFEFYLVPKTLLDEIVIDPNN